MSYWKVTISGIVQGVGFRPHVVRVASSLGLTGFVRNVGGIVEILVEANEQIVDKLIGKIRRECPVAARIDSITIESTGEFDTNGFVVADSETRVGAKLCSPDLGICSLCEAEVLSDEARRGGYWFNSCVDCGPRFTIIEQFPYDRSNTSMSGFALCEDCEKEYFSTQNRRFRAETVCCHKCAEPVLYFRGRDGELTGEQAFAAANKALLDGKVLAVKGVGGYHLMCGDFSTAIDVVRQLKQREAKPFAEMFCDLSEIEKYCYVSDEEKTLLSSAARPIVLLRSRSGKGRIGAFLPYTALHKLLLRDNKKLVATSLNVNNSPIIGDDEDALRFWQESNEQVFAGVLYNNRQIVRKIDDSVAQVVDGKSRTTRIARGYVPMTLSADFGDKRLLALGGDLKASFAVYRDGQVIAGPHVGDLENADTFDRYEDAIVDFLRLFDIIPDIIISDRHIRYFSRNLAERLARRFNAEVRFVFHHHAHVASIIAEQNIVEKVLGVAFDGTGYGEDGAVWGGEFLLCEGGKAWRFGHFEYVKLLGADSSAEDAAKTAQSYLFHHGLPFNDATIEKAIVNGINVYDTSSVGRLFDAVAALLGICQKNRYEGECAMMLQYVAEEARDNGVVPVVFDFDVDLTEDTLLLRHFDLFKMLAGGNVSVGAAALGFHIALANVVEKVSVEARRREVVNTIALSGGVFQNALLLSLTTKALEDKGFKVYSNERFPANDGGLCLGQLYVAAKEMMS